MERKIVKVGDEALRKVCKPMQKFDLRLWLLLRDMADTMYKADGVGLAAPQVGILRRVVVIDGVTDTTNIGAIFRSAAALGIDAVLLTPTACDPLNRRAVRVSMGSVFLVPWTWIEGDVTPTLNALGFKTAAMALSEDSISLDDPRLKQEPHLALIMGTEGDGLSHEAITAADHVVRIPMQHGVDSLNVAAAAAVAFWELRQR